LLDAEVVAGESDEAVEMVEEVHDEEPDGAPREETGAMPDEVSDEVSDEAPYDSAPEAVEEVESEPGSVPSPAGQEIPGSVASLPEMPEEEPMELPTDAAAQKPGKKMRPSRVTRTAGGTERRSKRTQRTAARRGIKTKPCASCGEPVTVGARKCPSCGEPFVAKKGGIGKKIIMAVVVLLVLAVGAFAGAYFLKPELLEQHLPGVKGKIDELLGAVSQTTPDGAAAPAESDDEQAPAEDAGTTEAGEVPPVGGGPRDLKLPGMDGFQVPDVPEVKLDTPTPSDPANEATIQD
jgi:hypothetical protein